jgi:hypothetical protein
MQANKNIKLRVSAGGDIVVDGQPVTPEQLATKLADLKQSGGSVWYHRESPAGEPHPNATTVIALVAANKLPIRLSAQPDFSDAVDDKGVSHPGVCLPDSGPQPIPRLPTARAYWHQQCGSLTDIRGRNFLRLANPFAAVGETICCGCERAVPIRQVAWADTGENIAAYRRRMRAAMPLGRRLFFSSLGPVVGTLAGFLCGYAGGILMFGSVGNRPWWMQASGFIGGALAAFVGLQLGAQLLPAPLMRLLWGLDYRGET